MTEKRTPPNREDPSKMLSDTWVRVRHRVASAFVAIWGLLRIFERFSAWPFAVYRGVMGVVLLACVFFGWLPN